MTNVLHLAAPGRNVGDNLLIQGVHNLFKPLDMDLTLKALNSSILTPKFIKETVNTYDLLLIGGGGLLHRSPGFIRKGQDWSGTLIRVKPEDMNLIDIPIIVYGVGYNTFPGELDLNENSHEFITWLAKHALHFSVRNDGSYKRLHDFLGRDRSRIKEVPDPGIYAGVSRVAPVQNEKAKIIFQLAADRMKLRLQQADSLILLDSISKVVNQFSGICDITFVAHTKDDEKFLIAHGIEHEPLYATYAASKKVLKLYKEVDLVISMRGHGVICPFGVGTPAIGISTHPKIDGWFQAIEHPEMVVKVFDIMEQLPTMIDNVLGDKQELFEQQQSKLKQFREKTNSVLEEIKHDLSSL